MTTYGINEIAKEYKIPSKRKFGTDRQYYLDNVYKYKADADNRVKGLRSMRYPARIVRVVKPEAKPKTIHTAVYWSPNQPK